MANTSSEADRLVSRFDAWRAAGHRALIPYVTAGYPRPGEMVELLHGLADAGADVIELGVPFSDPLADGPTIQRSTQAALEAGVTLEWTLDALARFREERDASVVVFSYLNPVLSYGMERFLADAQAAGAEGVLLTDLPFGSDPELEALLDASPVPLIRLIAPTTPIDRAVEIARRARGFLYYISRTGVTGATRDLRSDLATEVAALRGATDVPIAVGFGISAPEQAAQVAQVADGVIVGSALIEALGRGGIPEATAFLRSLREAIDRVR